MQQKSKKQKNSVLTNHPIKQTKQCQDKILRNQKCNRASTAENNLKRQKINLTTCIDNGHGKRTSPVLKSLDFLQKCMDKNHQNASIKAYNFVNNPSPKPLVDQPQIVNYIIQAMKQCNINYNAPNKNKVKQLIQAQCSNNVLNNKIQKDKSQTRLLHQSQRNSCRNKLNRSVRSGQNSARQSVEIPNILMSKLKFDPERQEMIKLNLWLNQKLAEHKNQQRNDGALITQRVHALHLAFSQACRQAGKHSQQISQLLVNIHSQYHSLYEQLINCLMKQNLGMKKKNQQLQQKLNQIIIHYEQELLNIRIQYDKKSNKVIQNFHKCINMKQQYEQQNKKLSKQLKSQQSKLEFMEQGLAKAIQILLQIGDKKFNFLSNEQQKMINALGSSFKNVPQNYTLFHKWCSTILKMIANMKEDKGQIKKIKQKDKQDQEFHHFRKFALSSVGKFMIDFDSTLSVRDAQTILMNFITHHHHYKTMRQSLQIVENPTITSSSSSTNNQIVAEQNTSEINILKYQEDKIKQIQSKQQHQKNDKSEQTQKNKKKRVQYVPIVPNLHEISEKFKGVSIEIQTQNMNQNQSKSIQVSCQKQDYGVLAKPKIVTKQTSTLNWMREKLEISRVNSTDMYVWGERDTSNDIPKNENKVKKSFKQTVGRKMSVISVMSALGSTKSKPGLKGNDTIIQKIKQQNENQIKSPTNTEKSLEIVSQQDQPQQKIDIKIDKSYLKHKSSMKKQRSMKKVGFIKKPNQSEQTNVYNDAKITNSAQSSPSPNNNKIQNKLDKNVLTNKLNEIQTQINGCKQQDGFDFERKPTKKKTVVIKNIQLQQTNLQDMRWSENDGSKSMCFINDSNQDGFRRIGMKSADLDMFVQNIITRRKGKRKDKFDQQYQELYERRSKQFGEKSQSKPENNNFQLDIHGRQINISSNKITNFQHQNSLNIKNLKYNDLTKQSFMIQLINQPKKSQKSHYKNQNVEKQKFQTHTHCFIVEFIQKLQQKNRKITQSTMWCYKKNIEIQKLIHKLHLSKQKIMATSNNIQVISSCIINYINPILQAYIKMFGKIVSSQFALTPNQFKNQLISGKKLCYYHRLAPLLHLLINFMSMSCFGIGKCTKYITTFYKGVKNIKNMDKKLEIYQQLIEGQTIHVDIFIKIVYYLSQTKSTTLHDQTVLLSVMQLQLFFILDSYLTPGQINNLITQIRSSKKENGQLTNRNSKKYDNEYQNNAQQRINLHFLTLKIFKVISQKKANLFKKYKSIIQILSNDNQSVSFNDLVYFIQAFPTDKKTRNKILYQSSFYLVYWDKKQSAIPIQRLLFLFQSSRFISTQALQKNLIIQYFKMKCEKQYKQIYDKLQHNYEYVVGSVYKLLYRVPPIIYRLTQDIKMNKNSKNNLPVLTVLYNMIIQDQLQKTYVSGYLNALAAIPTPF